MLSAIRKLFRPRTAEHKKLRQDYEAPGGDCDESDQEEQHSKGTSKQRSQLISRRDELRTNAGSNAADQERAKRPLTTLGGPTVDSYEDGSGTESGGGGLGFGDCNKTGSSNSSTSENCSSNSASSSSNCSSSSGSNSNCIDAAAAPNMCGYEAIREVVEDGDKQQQIEEQATAAEDYEEEDEDEDDFDDYNDELDEGPVAFIAEAPTKQQHHHSQQQQQQKQQKPVDNMSIRPTAAGQLKKATPQTSSSHHHHHQSTKTDVDQLLTGSASQQHRKDTVRGNLEELRVAESVNYRSVVYEYSFRVPDVQSNMRVFTDPDDRRIEAIARSCDTQIQLERPRPAVCGLMRTRKVTIQAPDLHSLEKCCRQFDDRFPHFYVSGGLGQSSKSIKRLYVDELESPQ